MKRQSDVVLDKSLAQTLAITITLTPKEAVFLNDHIFWTGESPEQLLNKLYAAYAEPNGEGEDRLWDIARDPKRRAAALKRHNLSASKIAALNKSLDATFQKLRSVWERETVKSLKRIPPQKRKDYLRNVPPEDVEKLLILAAS
jgi:hypothetical protein